MASGEQNEKIQAWRRAFVGLYWAITLTIAIVVIGSVCAVHFGWTQRGGLPPGTWTGSGPATPATCYQMLRRLSWDLSTATRTFRRRAEQPARGLRREWDLWAGTWHRRWEIAGKKCTKPQPGAKKQNRQAYGLFARVHDTLGHLAAGQAALLEREEREFFAPLMALEEDLQLAARLLHLQPIWPAASSRLE